MPRAFELSEATAARRRFPIYLVDATDGLTAETGESGGQPQITKNGAAFANTTATLTAVGNGHYYVELTATELDTLGYIAVRFKSAATAEFNMDGQVVAYDPYDSVRLGLTALPAAAADAAGGLPISDAGGLDLDTQLANTNEVTTARMAALTDWIDGGRLDLILDQILVDTAVIGAAGAGLTDLGGMSTGMKAEVETECIDALIAARVILNSTTIATLASQTSFTLTAGSADNDAYNGCIAVVEDVSTAVQKAIGIVSDYVGSTKTVTLVVDPGIFTMAATDKISILPPISVLGWLEAKVNALVSGRVDASTGALAAGSITRATFDPDTGLQTIRSNTAVGGGASVITLDAGSSNVVEFHQGDMILITGGTGVGQARLIESYSGASGICTIEPDWQTNPDATSTFAILPFADSLKWTSLSAGAEPTVTLPGQVAPPLTPTLEQMLAWIYKVLRNRKRQTATIWELMDDAETTVDAKATVSDDGTTAIKEEIITGP